MSVQVHLAVTSADLQSEPAGFGQGIAFQVDQCGVVIRLEYLDNQIVLRPGVDSRAAAGCDRLTEVSQLHDVTFFVDPYPRAIAASTTAFCCSSVRARGSPIALARQ